jgi:hypothetical protein
MNGSAMRETRGLRGVLATASALAALAPFLVACEGAGPPEYTNTPRETTIFSDGGLFGRSLPSQAQGGGIGVNNFLWRAALDSLAFMPLSSADPFGGVIVTDWHSLPEAPDERFKVNLFILGRELRADGLRAAVFRQRRDRTGAWADTPVDAATVTRLEDAILTRARELRLAQR